MLRIPIWERLKYVRSVQMAPWHTDGNDTFVLHGMGMFHIHGKVAERVCA